MALKDNKKVLLIDVMDAYYYQNDKLTFYSENLTSSNLTNSIDQDEVKNGKGNSLFATLNKGKNASIELTSNVFSFATVCLNSGTDIVTGKGVGYAIPKKYELTGANPDSKLTLEKKPLIPDELAFFDKDGEVVEGIYSEVDDTVTFATLDEGDVVKVMPYRYETAETASTITIDAETFATGGKLVLTTYERNANNEIIADIQIICERVMPEGSWELNTQSEVQAQDMSVNVKIMKDDDGNLYKIVRIPRA